MCNEWDPTNRPEHVVLDGALAAVYDGQVDHYSLLRYMLEEWRRTKSTLVHLAPKHHTVSSRTRTHRHWPGSSVSAGAGSIAHLSRTLPTFHRLNRSFKVPGSTTSLPCCQSCYQVCTVRFKGLSRPPPRGLALHRCCICPYCCHDLHRLAASRPLALQLLNHCHRWELLTFLYGHGHTATPSVKKYN